MEANLLETQVAGKRTKGKKESLRNRRINLAVEEEVEVRPEALEIQEARVADDRHAAWLDS